MQLLNRYEYCYCENLSRVKQDVMESFSRHYCAINIQKISFILLLHLLLSVSSYQELMKGFWFKWYTHIHKCFLCGDRQLTSICATYISGMLILSEVLTNLKWEAFWKTYNKSAYNNVTKILETLQESMSNKDSERIFGKEF